MTTHSTIAARHGSQVLTDRLAEAHVPYERIPHVRTDTARAEALALGVAPWQVAKTVILKSDDGFVRTVVPASTHVDLRKVRRVLGAQVELANEAEIAGAYPEFELGAVPPLGD